MIELERGKSERSNNAELKIQRMRTQAMMNKEEREKSETVHGWIGERVSGRDR